VRAAVFALIAAAVAGLAAQQLAALKITITVVDADGHVRPVPRHALLISDNPATAAPQRVVTSLDGVATIRLPPGNYTVESDQPLVFQGKSYEWMRTLDLVAGRDSAIEFTAADAEVGNVAAGAGAAALERGGASALLIDWQDSVVSIWSPTQLGAGFLIDARGLILTNQRLVRGAASVEVQFSPERKVAARVLSADANRNVAVLWIDPGVLAGAKPFRIAPPQGDKLSIAERDKVWAIDTRLDEPKSLASGTVSRVSTHTITSDIRLDTASAGVPLLDASGAVVGITTTGDDVSDAGDVSPRAVRIEDAAAVIAEANGKIQGATPPQGTLLPVEPQKPFDDEALKEAVRGRGGSLAAYQVPAADFDVSIITPVLLYANNHRGGGREGERGAAGGNALEMQPGFRALIEFANWADYVSDYPPVILIRATPKMVEGFWTTVARGAAQTQGVSIPALKHVKTGFSAMRLYCGDREVTPIHPLQIEQRVGETSVIDEGLYVYAPDAIGPACGTVKVTLISEKAPEKPDTRTIDPKVLQQIQQDFAVYRNSR
jgi:S1-C subfamily serine protease